MKVNNQKEFFERLQLDANGNVKVVIVSKSGTDTKSTDQYDFFSKIEITDEGYLKLYEV